MNLADLTTLIALVGCPIAAGAQAASFHAGWYAVLFVAGGVAVGIAVAYLVRMVAYFILMGGTRAQKTRPWLIVPVLIGYMIVPFSIAAAGISGTGNGTLWLIKHFLRS